LITQHVTYGVYDLNVDPLIMSVLTPTAPPETYPLSLHAALPISRDHDRPLGLLKNRERGQHALLVRLGAKRTRRACWPRSRFFRDRKSTRLNSSHDQISYAVFCLKKKKKTERKIADHCTNNLSSR